LVGLEAARLRSGEDVVFGRRLEAHPLALDVLLPLRPRLQAHLVATLDKRLAKRDCRERVARISERG
jgi:hypothetical protein